MLLNEENVDMKSRKDYQTKLFQNFPLQRTTKGQIHHLIFEILQNW